MTRSEISKIVAMVLAVAWLFVVVVAYYVVQKPFTGENALAILSAVGDMVVVLALFAIALGLGRRVLARCEFFPLEAIVIQAGFGLGAVSFTTFALGLLGLLDRILFWGVLALAVFLLRNELAATARTLRSIRLSRATRGENALAWFCGLSLALAFFVSLTPPVGWDSIQYHLVGPQLAIAQGRILPPPDNFSLNNPSLVEMLFLAAMILKSDIAAQLMHWGYLVLTIAMLLAFAQRYFTPRVGWLAAALLLAVPSLLLVATWAYNDLALAFYSFTALFLVMLGRDTQQTRMMVLAGVFAGFAMGEKYTAIFVPLALLGLLVRPRREALIQTIIFLLSAAIVAAPWSIRNWYFVGNPVYPFIWGGAYWDSFRTNWYSRFGTGLLTQPLRLLAVPWDATIRGALDFQAAIDPLFLALVPLWILTARIQNRRGMRSTKPLWLFVAVLYLAWLAGVAQSRLLWQTRLLFPAFPALAILAAVAVEHLGDIQLPQFSLPRFTALVIGVVLALTTLSNIFSFISENPLAFEVGAESREDYLARHLGSFYTVTQFVNTVLPADAKIFFLWETRAYYFRRAVNTDAILDRFLHLRYQFREADAIASYLRRDGYTHVLLYREGLDYILQAGFDPVSLQDAQALEDLLARHFHQVYGKLPVEIVTRNGKPGLLGAADDPYAVYELIPR